MIKSVDMDLDRERAEAFTSSLYSFLSSNQHTLKMKPPKKSRCTPLMEGWRESAGRDDQGPDGWPLCCPGWRCILSASLAFGRLPLDQAVELLPTDRFSDILSLLCRQMVGSGGEQSMVWAMC